MCMSDERDDLLDEKDEKPKYTIKYTSKEYSIDSEEAPLSTDIIKSSSGIWMPM